MAMRSFKCMQSPRSASRKRYIPSSRASRYRGASPVVEINAVADRADHPSVTLLGLDVLRAAAVTPSLIGERLASSAPVAKTQTGEENSQRLDER